MKRSSSKSTTNGNAGLKPIRCAIYTRKSTEEGLQQEFNTLDAQRESAEAYILAHKHEGWVCLPDRYDDGGFSGGTLDRPAFKRLMADVEAGRVDAIVIYKIDRLSRSLMDFARVMELLERHNVALIAITQSLDTKTSMGRLTLNILLSFAQFEREIISERTRDKIAAARRKGKWSGGKPLLGYDMLAGPGGTKIVVNEDEAQRVRTIFETYLKHEALLPAVTEVDAMGWTSKVWTTKAGKPRGGRRFDKASLYQLLTNVTYIGKVKYKDEVHEGEHEAIVEEGVWQKVQATLGRNGKSGGTLVRNKYGALLKGILRCGSCGCAMTHSYTSKGSKRYRYYVCLKAQKRGWNTCPTKSVPAGEIEAFVVGQIRAIGQDPALLGATVGQIEQQAQKEIQDLTAEQKRLGRDVARQQKALETATGATAAKARERLETLEQRALDVQRQLAACRARAISPPEVETALAAFDPVWAALAPREQARLIHLLVEQVSYDGAAGTLSLIFHPTGLRSLAEGRQEPHEPTEAIDALEAA